MGSLDGILTLAILAVAAAWAARKIWRWARRGPGSTVSGCVSGCDPAQNGCGHCAKVELRPEPSSDPGGRPGDEPPAGDGAVDVEN